MHFGKRLAEYVCPPGLVCMDYKRLKKYIKSSLFEDFLFNLEIEIKRVREYADLYISDLEIELGQIQQSGLEYGSLIQAEYLKIRMESLNLVETDTALLLKFLSRKYPLAPTNTGSSTRLASFFKFLDINSCGFRKIVKKFRKRSNYYLPIPYSAFIPVERVKDILNCGVILNISDGNLDDEIRILLEF
jgi:SPX domain protein involved in polyphosphate accumulation